MLIYLHAVLSLVKNAFKSIFRCTCSYNLVFILIQVDMINNDHIVQVLNKCCVCIPIVVYDFFRANLL